MCNVPDFFYSKSTQRTIGHSKGHWKALGDSGTPRALGHSRSQGTWPLGRSGTGALEHSKVFWTLEAHYLADSGFSMLIAIIENVSTKGIADLSFLKPTKNLLIFSLPCFIWWSFHSFRLTKQHSWIRGCL